MVALIVSLSLVLQILTVFSPYLTSPAPCTAAIKLTANSSLLPSLYVKYRCQENVDCVPCMMLLW